MVPPARWSIHETAPAAYGWVTVKNSNVVTMFDVERDESAGRSMCRWKAGSSDDAAALLLAKAGLDFEQLKAAGAHAGFPAGDASRRDVLGRGRRTEANR